MVTGTALLRDSSAGGAMQKKLDNGEEACVEMSESLAWRVDVVYGVATGAAAWNNTTTRPRGASAAEGLA